MTASKTILVVDDEARLVSLVETYLTQGGFRVVTASNGREALSVAERQEPDLIILDLMMPEMDGWEVYQQMKADETTKDIPVIVVTAKAQSIDKVLGLHIAKVDDYIAKPFSPQELLASVDSVLGRKQIA